MKMSELTALATNGISAAGKMAIALTLVRTENGRVKAGTAAPSPIYGGMDAVEVKRRRAAGKRARQARKLHRANV